MTASSNWSSTSSGPDSSGISCSGRSSSQSSTRGSKPAFTSDDLPLPEGPATATMRCSPNISTSLSTSSSRPWNSSASTSVKGRSPRYGLRVGEVHASPSAVVGTRCAVVRLRAEVVTTMPTTSPVSWSHTGAPLKPGSMAQ